MSRKRYGDDPILRAGSGDHACGFARDAAPRSLQETPQGLGPPQADRLYFAS
jgi:hypothetical protein